MAVSTNGRVSTTDLIQRIEEHTGRQARKVGREYQLLCPFHSDSNPSLNIREGDAGYPLIRCRSRGCTPEEVLGAVGLTWPDVFGDKQDHWMPNGRVWVEVYDYTDANGVLKYQVVRSADKHFSQRQPDPTGEKQWQWNLHGVTRLPYHLPQLIAGLVVGERAVIVEGERDVQALEAHGVLATCNSGGAGHWPEEFGSIFGGATVFVVADRDEPGVRHARDVERSLQPFAAHISMVMAREGKDAKDHLAAGFDVEDFVALVDALPDLPPQVEVESEEPSPPSPLVKELRFLTGREFIAQPLAKVIPLFGEKGDALMMPGSLMLLAGIGGAGKTTLSLHMLAHFAAGLPWFGITVGRPMRCVVIENEGPHDPYVEKVKEFAERFQGCTCSGEPHGSDEFLDNTCFQDSPWGRFTFEDSGLADELRGQVVDFGGDLVLANPLGRLGMKGAGTPEETRAFLSLLGYAGLGEDFAALLLHHLAKVQAGTPLVQQVSGDWGPHPDTIMVMESAGERRSKLAFGKVRWGDQGRPPMILDWLTDPDGPVGYTMSGVTKGVSDGDLVARVDRFLLEQQAPSGITAIVEGVKGKTARIRQMLELGVADGRYCASSDRRPVFWLSGETGAQEGLDV